MADNNENNKLTRVPTELISPEESLAHMKLVATGQLPPDNRIGNDGDIYIQLDENESEGS